jgi:hypothetical protein
MPLLSWSLPLGQQQVSSPRMGKGKQQKAHQVLQVPKEPQSSFRRTGNA